MLAEIISVFSKIKDPAVCAAGSFILDGIITYSITIFFTEDVRSCALLTRTK